MKFDALSVFLDRLTAWRIPGNSVSVSLEGREVFTYQSGFADVEQGIEMDPDKLINIYSCSKVTTVTAALQLYEKGFFLLDDPLYEFIPEYRDMVVSANGELRPAKTPITLRHLFTMTSGLTYNCETSAFDRARELTEGKMDTVTVAKCLARDPLAFEPGQRWGYSLSHDVLAAVVSVISGKKFRTYVQENIFDPLDMKVSCYHNEDVRHLMARQYRFVDNVDADAVSQKSGLSERGVGGQAVPISLAVNSIFGSEYDSGGAGITTSVRDYSKLCAALANGGIGGSGEKILSAGTIDLLRTDQLKPEHRKDFCWPQLKGYGYGLGVRTMVDKAVGGTTGNLGEFGWGGAAGATVLVDPQLKMSVFYAHHMLNPHEDYYQPRLRNVFYGCL